MRIIDKGGLRLYFNRAIGLLILRLFGKEQDKSWSVGQKPDKGIDSNNRGTWKAQGTWTLALLIPRSFGQ
jgi:hypothetical protein